jgi:hypothetical protein
MHICVSRYGLCDNATPRHALLDGINTAGPSLFRDGLAPYELKDTLRKVWSSQILRLLEFLNRGEVQRRSGTECWPRIVPRPLISSRATRSPQSDGRRSINISWGSFLDFILGRPPSPAVRDRSLRQSVLGRFGKSWYVLC